MSETNYLEFDEIALLHHDLIERYGGTPGIKSESLLESAANRPRFKAHYETADLVTQAAALMFGLAKNHAFHDGNKRIAAAATSTFLRLNGFKLACDNDTLATFLEACSEPDWTEDHVHGFLSDRVRGK